MRVGIAGAGLLGRLVAWRLASAGHALTVFDPAAGSEPAFDGRGAAAFSAAGMLCPSAELDTAEASIAELGWRSIGLWRAITAELAEPALLIERGSLLLAHRDDLGSAQRVLARLSSIAPAHAPRPLDAAQLAKLEPAVHGAAHAWLLPGEARIDPVGTMQALHRHARAVQWHWRNTVTRLEPGRLLLEDGRWSEFDWVFDLRGVGARQSMNSGAEAGGLSAQLRGVRGETVWLHAPRHGLTRPLRLLHPRHRVYLVPRSADLVFVGATEIESSDRSEVSLRSAVELMAAAHSVMPALAEARIVRLDRNLRPALPDHLPRIETQPGLTRINGLFRHGWMIAPALIEQALRDIDISVTDEATS